MSVSFANLQAIVLQETLALSQRVQGFLECIPKQGVEQCYVTHDALTIGWALTFIFVVYSFVWSILGQNCSKVDQIWSITPVVFVGHALYHYARTHNGVWHMRLALLTVLVTLWGARLTFNFWRKGGYGNFFVHEEDYRWPILRKQMHPFIFWVVFNLSFIATYQNVLLFLIAAPAFEVYKTAPHTLLQQDYVLGGLFLFFFLIETIADEQHFKFQTLKHSLNAEQRANHSDPDIRRGFFTHGLFSLSRHPNYFSEQTMWVIVYLFTVNFSAANFVAMHNWSFSGCVQLILLFQGSMNFSESICASKYPEYKEYQKKISRCILGLPGSLGDDKKTK